MKSFRDMKVENLEEANVVLVGVPFDKNVSVSKGARKAPKILRKLSYELPALDRLGNNLSKIKVYDAGDIKTSNFDTLQEEVEERLYRNNKFHLIFGGDHSISIASERAFYDYAYRKGKTPVIIHIDAHPDICEEFDGTRYSHACTNYRSLEYGYEDKNITLIGIRGFEAQEIEIFKQHKDIDVFKADDVKKMGVETLVKLLAAKYSDPKYLVYISYDIDANDPAYAPGTGTPEAFGLTSEETMFIITSLVKLLNVDTLDIVEVSPPLDVNNITGWLAVKTLYEVFSTILRKNPADLH